MRITISGTPGSGKSVVSKYLSKKLKLKYYTIGELMRDFAKKKKLDLIELGNLMESNKKLDKKFNESIKKLNKKDNFILDSRLGFFFIKKGIHIFLDADLDLRAKRIFKDKRKLENFKTIRDVKDEINKRFLSERRRFKKLYNLDFTNLKHYNLVINTTRMDVGVIYKIILKYLKKNDI